MSGAIIFLNGASSSGKSSIARALQAKIEAPFWNISIDHLRDAGVLPLDRVRRGDFDWKTLREPFFEGFHSSLAAYALAGNNLIVEHIIETKDWLFRLLDLLGSHDVFFVGVHCPLEELERREVARGDRRIGDARRDFYTAHAYAEYDLELDSTQSPSDNVEHLLAAWRARLRPNAFDRLVAARRA